MKKIAILIADNIYNRKGMMNAELNRISHLQQISSFNIDVFAFQGYFGWFVRKIRHQRKIERPKTIVIDGICINIEWIQFSLIDYFLTVKLHQGRLVNKNWQLKYVENFRDYDMIVANSMDLGYLAYLVNQRFSTPYYVTWHGTDIHTAPFKNHNVFIMTKLVLQHAELNFMVSKALQDMSKKILPDAKTIVLYNGVNNSFYKYEESKRLMLRKKNEVVDKKVIAFAGHLIEVKNPQLFPEIFKLVKEKYQRSIEFWVLGTGKLGNYVKAKCKEYAVPLRMWGDILANDMPDMLNCVDVLILPSRNEGLPLIAIEAIACGVNVVGAKVGGIPEVIGVENTFAHGDNFLEEISNRIVNMLNNRIEQPLLPCFSWVETARIENNIYKEYFDNH